MRIYRYTSRDKEDEFTTSNIPCEERREKTIAVPITRSKNEAVKTKKICFICQEQRVDMIGKSVDNNQYNQGGLGRCSTDESAKKIEQSMLLHLNDNTPGVFNSAAKRLQVEQCGPAHDIFALE